MKFSPTLCSFGAAAVALAGCVSAPERRAAPAKPLPPELQQRLETVRGERPGFPRFSDIPFTPDDVRTPVQFRAAVDAVKAEGAELQAWIAANPPEMDDVSGFAEATRRRLGLGPADAPPADQAAQIEAMARELRRKAEPPPPIPD